MLELAGKDNDILDWENILVLLGSQFQENDKLDVKSPVLLD